MLIRLPFPMAFKPMQGNIITMRGWHMLEKGDILFILQRHALTQAHLIEERMKGQVSYAQDSFFAGISSSRFLWGFQSQMEAAKNVEHPDTTKQALAEYKETNEIDGFSALVGDRMVWISHFDVELLQPYAF